MTHPENREILKSNIRWMMGIPAGLKLNENLDNFLGMLFLSYIDLWPGKS
jgi:hypothetical protein